MCGGKWRTPAVCQSQVAQDQEVVTVTGVCQPPKKWRTPPARPPARSAVSCQGPLEVMRGGVVACNCLTNTRSISASSCGAKLSANCQKNDVAGKSEESLQLDFAPGRYR